MQVKRFNISKPKKYTNRNNEEKTQWNNIGSITEFHKEDGSVSRIIEIPAIGLEANIFPFQPKGQTPDTASRAEETHAPLDHNSDVSIETEEIPF